MPPLFGAMGMSRQRPTGGLFPILVAPPAAAANAMTWIGSQTTEATTTSTTEVDLLSISALSIGANTPFSIRFMYRKSAGAAATASSGLKLNTTTVEAPGVGAIPTNAINEVESGFAVMHLHGTSSPYVRPGLIYSGIAGVGAPLGGNAGLATANMPAAPITDLVSLGLVGNPLITLGHDEMQAHTLAVS